MLGAMEYEVVAQQRFAEGARQARRRVVEAQHAAERARKRVAELRQRQRIGPIGPAEAEERRLLAEERLAQVEASLARARHRSVNAHERAGKLDDRVGKRADAQRHYDAADDERQLIEDAATSGAQRRARPTDA
jgi:hypothetical protein